MARFFFHIRDGDQLITDPEGNELPDFDAARAEAHTFARHLLAERLRAGKVLDGQCFEITDAAGTLLAVVPMGEVLRLP
ncbi:MULTISPECIES: hypothetical protein [unclassified Methylobacterium]|uniref:DUF6894 family protein n=1 Tax=unclassified Methylobacterium TaxID=2615210 RepID=UPI00226AFABA|nr:MULTISPECIES: hypothetical protein [unclassified Methylobacterium]